MAAAVERAQAYMLKAAREAKQQTTWTANNKEFEDALSKFIAGTLQHPPFLRELEQFVDKVKDAGRINSLAQTLMKHTAPGVPDTLSGNGDMGLEPGRSGQPPTGGLRACAAQLLKDLKTMTGDDVAAR